ncbi:MAG: hypothetical protein E6I33_05375 [Chloroflexi bacterium]|nr:MAG: hypothetical protein E6I33_05375 [Chloroflexota bacterium]
MPRAPAPVVEALVRAGISRTTALAMERHKAQEILDLLDPVRAGASEALTAGVGTALGHGRI